MKKETWKQIFQIVLTILTALGTTLGVTSCMGRNRAFLLMRVCHKSMTHPLFSYHLTGSPILLHT